MTTIITSTRTSAYLANSLSRIWGIEYRQALTGTYPDGEIKVVLYGVKGCRVIIVGSTAFPSENIIELALLADAAREGGALRIEVIIPYMGYSRQDAAHEEGMPVSARAVARMLSAVDPDSVVCCDLHKKSVADHFTIPVKHASALEDVARRAAGKWKRFVIAAPDKGAALLAKRVAKGLNMPVVLGNKKRLSATTVDHEGFGSLNKREKVILVDDMVQSGGTILAAVRSLRNAGAGDIRIAVTHFVPTALFKKRRKELTPFISGFYVSDTVAFDPCAYDVRVVSSVNAISRVIRP